jgi:hypothetical protein
VQYQLVISLRCHAETDPTAELQFGTSCGMWFFNN